MQQMMMRPKAVTVYLPLVEEVVDDFITRIKKIRNDDGTISDFRLEAAKWNLECKNIIYRPSRPKAVSLITNGEGGGCYLGYRIKRWMLNKNLISSNSSLGDPD